MPTTIAILLTIVANTFDVAAQPDNGIAHLELAVGGSEVTTHQSLPPTVHLSGPSVLDFGEVYASGPPEHACLPVNLSGAHKTSSSRFTLTVDNADRCKSDVMFVTRTEGQPSRQLNSTTDIDLNTPFEVCLITPLCASDKAEPNTALVITPTIATEANQTLVIPISWTVIGRGWMTCNAFWVVPACGACLLVLIVLGLILPHRFPDQAIVMVAKTPKRLKHATAIRLLACPGSNCRFFQNAKLAIHSDRSIRSSLRHANVLITACLNGVVVSAPGGLERYDHKKRTWLTVVENPVSPCPNTIYRAGEVCFKVAYT